MLILERPQQITVVLGVALPGALDFLSSEERQDVCSVISEIKARTYLSANGMADSPYSNIYASLSRHEGLRILPIYKAFMKEL